MALGSVAVFSCDAVHGQIAAPADQVADPFIAMVIGLLVHDAFVCLGGDTLRHLFPQLADAADIPFESLHSFSRVPLEQTAVRRFQVNFAGDLEVPLPIRILGYHPGRVRLAKTITGDQRVIRRIPLPHPDPSQSSAIGPVYVVEFEPGDIQVDLDWWLDLLLGRNFGDLDARLVLIFRYRRIWFGVLGGYGNDGRVLSWTFELKHSYFLVRPPPTLASLAEIFL